MHRRPLRFRIIRASILIAVFAVILFFRLAEEIGPERGTEGRFRVVRILDGDTMELAGGDRLRLIGVDAPERGVKYSEEASAFLARHAVDKVAAITYGPRRRDRYGRLLGYVSIDGFDLNKSLIDSGLAFVYIFKDNDPSSEEIRSLIESQRSAIARKVGLWSQSYEREEEYINLEGSFRLHRPSCRSAANRKPGRFTVFETREDGLATGLSPCRNCRP